jgi:Ca2+-binding RTX toxin-like protein
MMIEPLEARRLLAVSYTFEGGTMTVFGTEGRDNIRMEMMGSGAGSMASLYSAKETLFAAGTGDELPWRVVVWGRGGNDRLKVSQALIRIPVKIHGNKGEDRITLDSVDGFPAEVWGDAGNDVILVTGRGWSERHRILHASWREPLRVWGGMGNDVIRLNSLVNGFGEPPAPAIISGGVGNDWISSGHGDDEIDGGGGADTLIGGPGDDVLVGGMGRDRFLGGRGKNVVTQD